MAVVFHGSAVPVDEAVLAFCEANDAMKPWSLVLALPRSVHQLGPEIAPPFGQSFRSKIDDRLKQGEIFLRQVIAVVRPLQHGERFIHV